MFGGSHEQPAAAPAPAPAIAPPVQAPAPAVDHGAEHAPPAPQVAPAAQPHDPSTGAPAPKKVDQKAMDAAANTIFKKMDGWWVSGGDKSAILDTLRGKSPEEVAAIKASYGEHFPGHDMDADLGKNLSGKDLTEAKASLSGDPVAASVAAIKNAETGTFFGNVDSDKVKTILEGITDPKVRAEVQKQVGGEITSMQSGNDRELTKALLEGDTAKAGAVKLDESLHGGLFGGGGFLGMGVGQDKDTMYKAIEDCKDAKQREALLAAYQTKTGSDLKKDLHANLEGANADVADKLLDGDKNAANAARIKAATESWFTDKDAIYKAMEGKNPDERAKMMADFKDMYGKNGGKDLDGTLHENLSGLDLQKAQELETKGQLTDAFALKYAMEGSFWSTDKNAIKSTLAGKSPSEIDKLSKEYKEKYGIDLKGELGETTSGRDGFEIKELLKGEPVTPEDKVARARERYDFERGSGSNSVSKAICDTFSDKGQMLDQQQQRMEALYTKISSGQASAEEKALLDRVTGYQNLDTKNYQESKDSVTNGAVAVAAITAGAIATVATGGAAAPAEVAIIAALAGGGATIATKAIIQDGGYSNEELRNDIIMTGVNAATGGLMGAAGAEGGQLFNMAMKASDNPIVQQAIIQGVSGAVSTGVGNATQTMIGGGDAKSVLKAGGMGVLTGGTTGAVTGGLGAGLKDAKMFEGMDPVRAAMLRNAIAGGTGAAAGKMIDPDAYKGDSGQMLTAWGTAVGGGAFTGLAAGHNEGTAELAKAKAATTDPAVTKVVEPVANTNEPVTKVVEPVANANEPVTKVVEPVANANEPVAKGTTVEAAVDAVNVPKAEELAGPRSEKPSDAGDREAIMELSRQAKTPEERAQIAEWAAEIDANNPKPMLESLRDLNIEARADNHLDPKEGSALREWGHEASLDRMPLLDAMTYEGLEKAEVARVFEKAVGNDAGASLADPNNLGIHTAADGTPLAVPGSGAPGALTPEEMKLLIDVQGRRFDELHTAYTTSSGREVEASPMRKAVNESTAAEYAAGERLDSRTGTKVPTDKIGGDVGLASNTDGQHAERAAATLGLDYDHHSNQYFDPATNTWTPMVSERGLPILDFGLSPEMHENLTVPLGTDATEAFKNQGRALEANGEYVPELLRSKTSPEGAETFPHLSTRDRQNQVDPRVGFGFSATERAIDPATGLPHPVIPNQEHTTPYTPVADYEVGAIPPAKALAPEAQLAVAAAPESAKPIAENPGLASKVQETPELAPVIAAAPELAPEMAAQSPVSKIAEQVAEAAPTMTPQEAFEKAQAANSAKAPIAEDVNGFLAAADKAREGANPELQAQRASFEKAVALSPEAHAAVQETLDTMSAKALDYMAKTRGGNLDEALSMLGKDPSARSYAGAVGTDPATIKAVLEGGNVRERMVALAEFQEKILGADVLKPGGMEDMRAMFGKGDSAFGPADVERLAARREQYLAENGDKPTSVKGLFGPLGGEDGPHAAYAEAKAQGMDTKLPSFTPEVASEVLGTELPGPIKGGEASPLAKSALSVAEAQASGLELSPREIAQAGGEDKQLPWVVGSRANMVDPSAPFIADAAAASMPLKAGISGTTFRAMGLFDALGADPTMARLACMAQLTSIEAHSFHEIASASQGFFPEGSPSRYDPSTPYTPATMGLDPEVLAKIAAAQGLTLEQLNAQMGKP